MVGERDTSERRRRRRERKAGRRSRGGGEDSERTRKKRLRDILEWLSSPEADETPRPPPPAPVAPPKPRHRRHRSADGRSVSPPASVRRRAASSASAAAEPEAGPARKRPERVHEVHSDLAALTAVESPQHAAGPAAASPHALNDTVCTEDVFSTGTPQRGHAVADESGCGIPDSELIDTLVDVLADAAVEGRSTFMHTYSPSRTSRVSRSPSPLPPRASARPPPTPPRRARTSEKRVRVSESQHSAPAEQKADGTIWDRLYQGGLQDIGDKKRMLLEHEMKRREEEDERHRMSCTFRPSTSARAEAERDLKANPGRIFDALFTDAAAKTRRRDALQERHLNREAEQKQQPRKGKGWEVSFFERLYNEAAEQRERQEQREQHSAPAAPQTRRVTHDSQAAFFRRQQELQRRTESLRGTLEETALRVIFDKAGRARRPDPPTQGDVADALRADERVQRILTAPQHTWSKLLPRTMFAGVIAALEGTAGRSRSQPADWAALCGLVEAQTVLDEECTHHPRTTYHPHRNKTANTDGTPVKLTAAQMKKSVSRLYDSPTRARPQTPQPRTSSSSRLGATPPRRRPATPSASRAAPSPSTPRRGRPPAARARRDSDLSSRADDAAKSAKRSRSSDSAQSAGSVRAVAVVAEVEQKSSLAEADPLVEEPLVEEPDVPTRAQTPELLPASGASAGRSALSEISLHSSRGSVESVVDTPGRPADHAAGQPSPLARLPLEQSAVPPAAHPPSAPSTPGKSSVPPPLASRRLPASMPSPKVPIARGREVQQRPDLLLHSLSTASSATGPQQPAPAAAAAPAPAGRQGGRGATRAGSEMLARSLLSVATAASRGRGSMPPSASVLTLPPAASEGHGRGRGVRAPSLSPSGAPLAAALASGRGRGAAVTPPDVPVSAPGRAAPAAAPSSAPPQPRPKLPPPLTLVRPPVKAPPPAAQPPLPLQPAGKVLQGSPSTPKMALPPPPQGGRKQPISRPATPQGAAPEPSPMLGRGAHRTVPVQQIRQPPETSARPKKMPPPGPPVRPTQPPPLQLSAPSPPPASHTPRGAYAPHLSTSYQQSPQPQQQQQQQQPPAPYYPATLLRRKVRLCTQCGKDKAVTPTCSVTRQPHRQTHGDDRSSLCGACGLDVNVVTTCPNTLRPHQVLADARRPPSVRF